MEQKAIFYSFIFEIMSKSSALITSGRKLSGNEGSFLLSIYDLEPSGIVVTAYNQVNSKEYSLPISEMEVSLQIASIIFWQLLI